MEPMPLALLTQRPPPLELNFVSNPVQFLLAVMEPEVLVEADKHRPQMALLGASLPVRGEPNDGEPSSAIDPADVFEAQKLEGLRPLAVPLATLRGEPAKGQQPSLLLGKLQVELCEALLKLSPKGFRVRQMLETHHEVIDEAYEMGFASTLSPELAFEPQVKGVVQVDIGEILARMHEIGPPCGVPSSARITTPLSIAPALSHFPIRLRIAGSTMRSLTIRCSHV